jgi:hypothetical protein
MCDGCSCLRECTHNLRIVLARDRAVMDILVQNGRAQGTSRVLGVIPKRMNHTIPIDIDINVTYLNHHERALFLPEESRATEASSVS